MCENGFPKEQLINSHVCSLLSVCVCVCGRESERQRDLDCVCVFTCWLITSSLCCLRWVHSHSVARDDGSIRNGQATLCVYNNYKEQCVNLSWFGKVLLGRKLVDWGKGVYVYVGSSVLSHGCHAYRPASFLCQVKEWSPPPSFHPVYFYFMVSCARILFLRPSQNCSFVCSPFLTLCTDRSNHNVFFYFSCVFHGHLHIHYIYI